MTKPKAYEPIEGKMYQILIYDNYNREYDHLDYAKDREEKDFLLKEYRISYGNGFTFKVIKLPKKYHPKEEIETSTYKVIDYFDVWGNMKDGWEVNNLAKVGEITVKDYTDYNEIFRALKDLDYLAKHVRVNMFDVYNDYEFIEFIRKVNGKPIFRLELISK